MTNVLRSLGVVALALLAVVPKPTAQTGGLPLHITASAINANVALTGANTLIDIRIERWSTPAERAALVDTFIQKGDKAFLRALQDESVKGRIRTPARTGPDPNNTRSGWDLRYAHELPGENGGRHIVIGTDRELSLQETVTQQRSVDYPLTYLDIRLKADGTGEGRMAVAAKLKFDKKNNTIELENYANEPLRLANVKIEAN